MFARLSPARKISARLFALAALLYAAACVPITTISNDANTGQSIDTSIPVQVALLTPTGTGDGTTELLAANLENAARMAIADLEGVEVDLRVYSTGGDPTLAAAAATRAVDDGAKIILGPLFAEAANAAGVAVAGRNVNVLSFSNNPTIAGGNVFVLGATFSNTANRLVGYANRQGLSRIAVVHGEDLQGQVGRDAIVGAIRANGAQLAGITSYPVSQQGILTSGRRMASDIRSGGADAIFLTAGVNADLPIVATALPDAGINPINTKYIGLTRWSAVPQALALPGLQGGIFALPDRGLTAGFDARYVAQYGEPPHPLAGLAYDGIAAIGALVATGDSNALTKASLTTPQGFSGTSGVFRFLPNGLNQRGLAIAEVRDNQVAIVEQAPRSFGSGL